MVEKSTRQQVAEWVRAQMEGQEAVSLPDLVNDAVAHFEPQRSFVRQFLAESLRPIIYDLASTVAKQSRRNFVVAGDELVTREELTERSNKRASRWESWLEHVGGKHVRLLDMTREELILAADIRRGRADSELRIAHLWDALAAKLEGGQRVRDRFTPAEIETMRRLMNERAKGEAA